MKNSRKFLFGSLLLVAMTGCVGGVAVAGDDGGVYYGGGPVSYTHLDVYKRQGNEAVTRIADFLIPN